MDKMGTRKVFIGHHQHYGWPCPNCSHIDTVWFDFYTQYYYAGWVFPMMPYEKDGHARCSNCEFKIDSIKYNRATRDDYKIISRNYRHPLYTYIGLSIGLLMGLGIVVSIVLAMVK